MRSILIFLVLLMSVAPATCEEQYVTVSNNGSTDFKTVDYGTDTEALEAATAYASNNDIGTVAVLGGIYYVDRFDVPGGIHVMGMGSDTEFIKANGTTGYGIGTAGDDVVLSDFMYDGNAQNATSGDHGIRIDAADDVELYGLTVHNTVHHGITGTSGCSNIYVHDCEVFDTGALGTQDGAGIIVNGQNVRVTDNYVRDTAYHGIQAYTASTDVIIANNMLSGCGKNTRAGGSNGAGIKVSLNCKRAIVSGNSVYNQAGEGILIDNCAEVTAIGNIVTNASRGVYINNADYVACNSNIVTGSRGYGIYAYNSGCLNIGNNIVKDSPYGFSAVQVSVTDYSIVEANSVFNTLGASGFSYGVRLESTSPKNLVTGNSVSGGVLGQILNLGNSTVHSNYVSGGYAT